MKLVIQVELDNDAFEQEGLDEVYRILSDIVDRLPQPLRTTGQDLSLHDANGNWVGFARVAKGKAVTR